MLTQKVLQDLLLHYSLEQEGSASSVLVHLLNQLTERLERIEELLEKRQIVEVNQLKTVQRSMLNKVEKQLRHIEETHAKTFSEVTVELKAVKQTLESTKSRFIGFE
jgi:wyosine [tRNA(Phe)-imidazoG37] synthetase (radical SAM superfamily)